MNANLEKILPLNVYLAIQNVGIKNITEIRLRKNCPIVLSLLNGKVFLAESGATKDLNLAMIATKTMIEDVVFRSAECSIYSVSEQIKQGFILISDGVRVGLGGDVVTENGQIKTMTNYSSVNIRVPHIIMNCSLCVFDEIVKDRVQNTLIISPVGCGKTTFLRDIIWQMSQRNIAQNVLVLDERGEIDAVGMLGNFADKICYTSKLNAMLMGIRSLAPDVIFSDELGGANDLQSLVYAKTCGVSVVATIHASNLQDLQQKPEFKEAVASKFFKRFVVLSSRLGVGTFEGLYNENFSRLK